MRRFALPVLLVLAAACGSADPVGVPPPPPPSDGSPASITIQAGDGQQAAPGSAVAVAPAVVVKSAAGAPLAGVTVTFAVDSGGGSITGGTAVTNAGGVAALVGWTLGSALGRNVLRVTVTGLAPMFIAATAVQPLIVLAQNVSIGSNGGTVTYTKTGDSLSGLSITIPASAYHTTTQWTVTAKSGVSVPLPAHIALIGPVIGITNGQAYADSIMTVRIPMRVGFDTALAAFLYDSNTATLEMVPIVNRTATAITIATRHFSADRLLRPATALPSGLRSGLGRPTREVSPALHSAGPAPATASFLLRPFVASLHAPNPPPFGTVDLVTVELPESSFGSVAFTTSFVPGVDDWEFPNYPTAAAPTGNAAGMTVSALLWNYIYRRSAFTPPLNNTFNELAGYWQADPLGIRLGADIVHETDLAEEYGYAFAEIQAFANESGVPYDVMEYQSLLLAMAVTGRPQYFIAYQPGGVVHSMIAFAAQNGQISVADPNAPGTSATVTYSGQAFTPHMFADNALATPQSFSRFAVEGASTLVDMDQVRQAFTGLFDEGAGVHTYPTTWLEYYDYRTATWEEIPAYDPGDPATDTLRISSDTFLVRTNCANCGHQRAASNLPTRQYNEVVEEVGDNHFSVTNDRPDLVRGSLVPMNPRTRTFGITSYAYTKVNPTGAPDDWEFEYADFQRLVVISDVYTISPRAVSGPVDSEFVFVAHGPDYPAGTKFHWTTTDADGDVSTLQGDSPSVTGAPGAIGSWKIKVEVFNPEGIRVSADSTTGIALALGVTIDPAHIIVNQPPFEANPGDPVTFIANINSTTFRPQGGIRYVWHFGDPGNAPLTAGATVTHTYSATSSSVGSFAVTVELYDKEDNFLGQASTAARIKVWPPIWRFTSFTRTAATPLPKTYDTTGSFHAVLDSIDLYMGKLIFIPGDGLVLISDDSSYSEHSIVLTISRTTDAGPLYNNWVFGDYFTLLGRTCCSAGVVTDVGTSINGTLDGWSSTTGFQGGQYNTITAIKSSTTANGIVTGTLTGTINIWSPFQPYGQRTYQFTAVKVSP